MEEGDRIAAGSDLGDVLVEDGAFKIMSRDGIYNTDNISSFTE